MVEHHVSIAKITGPRPVKAISRDRLFQEIDQARGAPAVWIAGPGGSGKTTLVSSYLESRKLPALWYHLDAGDDDVATFFHYMGLAARKAAPDRGALPLLTPEYARGVSTFAKRFFEELFANLEKPAALVLDNYQEVPAPSSFHEIIRESIPIIPGQVTVFILSRTDPPTELARAAARRAMAVIGWKELRFSLEETRELVRLLGEKTYTRAAVDGLHRKTGGWVAGLLLLLRQAGREEIDPAFLGKHTPEEVFQYFATELFDRADPETQEFLLATAIFPQMTPEMAEALTGASRAKERLDDMRRGHLFTSRRLGKGAVYEYHPLFREFLLARGRGRYTAVRLADLGGKAAALLEKEGQVEAAMSLYHSSGDVGNMVRLILNQAQTLIFQGRHLTLHQWLVRLPDELVGQEPWLLYWLASCKAPVDPAEGRDVFKKALAVSQAQDDTNGTLHAVCSVIETITHEFDSFTDVDQWVPKLHAIYQEIGRFSSKEIEARVTSSFLYSLAFRQPDSETFKSWRQKGLDILDSEEEIDPSAALQLLLPIMLHAIFSGELSEAQFLLGKYRKLIQSESAGPLVITGRCNLESYCAWHGGRLDECLRIAAEGLETASATGVYTFSTYLAGHAASAALSMADPVLAAEYIRKMEATLGHARAWGKGHYHTMSTWLALLEDRPGDADFHSRQAVECQEKTGCSQALAITQLARTLALRLMEEKEAAGGYLEKTLTTCRQAKTSQIEFGCYLARAEFALEDGNEAVALDSLRRAMALGRKQGYVNNYFWRPRVMARLCEKALGAGIEVAYVRGLIRARGLVPEHPPWETENWPWPIRIFTLGRFDLEIDGAPFSFSGRVPKTPLLLLKALVASGGRDVDEAALQDALWPDADGDAASNSFSTTLHRLRKMLGCEKAVRVSNGKVSLDDRLCWVDVQLFKNYLKQVENIGAKRQEKGETEPIQDIMNRMMVLAPGVFLPDESSPWAISLREELKDRLFQCFQKLVRHLVESENVEPAVSWCNRALTLNPCNEYFYQQLMRIYAAQGLRSQVLAVYHRCCGNLAAVYGIQPSEKTRAVFQYSKES